MGAPAPSAEADKAKIEYELRGKTLKVYAYVLKQGKPVGVREVQRELGFSSPSVAYHHIEKLTRLGIIEQDTIDRKSTRLNSSHLVISYAVFCLKKKKD